MQNKIKYQLMLKQYRLEINLTQHELAQKIGESQSYVSKYENGERRLDLYELEKICLAMQIPLIDFIRKYLES